MSVTESGWMLKELFSKKEGAIRKGDAQIIRKI